jgi:hypothetical protein
LLHEGIALGSSHGLHPPHAAGLSRVSHVLGSLSQLNRPDGHDASTVAPSLGVEPSSGPPSRNVTLSNNVHAELVLASNTQLIK